MGYNQRYKKRRRVGGIHRQLPGQLPRQSGTPATRGVEEGRAYFSDPTGIRDIDTTASGVDAIKLHRGGSNRYAAECESEASGLYCYNLDQRNRRAEYANGE